MRRLAAVLALAATCVQADYREGLEHLSRGRFDEAYAELKASADAGDVNSARYLGWLLERGMTYHGTTSEPRIDESTQWYRKAAELGDRHSQDMLGVAYASDAASDLESLAMKYGRIAMESAPPTPGAVRNRFEYLASVDFRFRQ